MIKRGNKRAQELSTNAIVLIILAVVILVILIFGFTMGWNKIAPWISSSNTDTIVNQCEIACNTKSAYDFCGKPRELKSDDLPDGSKMVSGTCEYFSKDARYLRYGIKTCQAIDCSDFKKPCEELELTIESIAYVGNLSNVVCADGIDLTISASNTNSTHQWCCAKKK